MKDINQVLKIIAKFIIGVIFVAITIVSAMAYSCYQEDPQVSNQSGRDGHPIYSCNLNYSGNTTLVIPVNTANINETYIKPPRSTSASKIVYKAGFNTSANYVLDIREAAIPTACWNYNDTRVIFEIYTQKNWNLGGQGKLSCYNGTGFQQLWIDGCSGTYSSASVGADMKYLRDGNWSTWTLYEGLLGYFFWGTSYVQDTSTMGCAIWETAMNWSVSDSPVPTFDQVPQNISIYHNENLSIQYNATDPLGGILTWAINDTLVNLSSGLVLNMTFDTDTTIVTTTNTSYWCYQEFANTTTSCGGLSTGVYYSNTTFWAEAAIDGNWSTSNSGGNEWFFINYTKPTGATNESKWQISLTPDPTNITITKACWEASSTVVRFAVNSESDLDARWYCWDGSAWNQLAAKSGDRKIYEEAMWWNITNTTNTTTGANPVIDYSPFGNNGTIRNFGNVTWTAAGKSGGAYTFSGVRSILGNSINIPDADSLDITTSWTISMWVKPRTIVYLGFISKNGASTWGIVSYDDALIDIESSNNGVTDGTVSTVANSWEHWTWSSNGTHVFYYRNGTHVFNYTHGAFLANTANLTLGYELADDLAFNGTMDEVKMWNRTLTADEIKVNAGILRVLATTSSTGLFESRPTISDVGTHHIRINVTNGQYTANASIIYEIKNRAPAGGLINITPRAPGLSEAASCNIQEPIIDADGDALTYTYDWYKFGVSQGINNSILAASYTGTPNEVWYCTLVAYDGLINSSKYISGTVVINSTSIQPYINLTIATTALTGIVSDSTNPTNNNSWVNLSVTFQGSSLVAEAWTGYFCKTPEFNGACSGGEFCHTAINSTMSPNISCRYTVSPETSSAINYWVYVISNSSLWESKAGTFAINFPPTVPVHSPVANGWVTTTSTILAPTSSDPNSDTITYYIYGAVEDSPTPTILLNISVGTPAYNWSGLNNSHYYYWKIKANDSHGYESDFSASSKFGVDTVAPNITSISFTSSLYTYQTQTFTMICSDAMSGVNLTNVYVNTSSLFDTYTLTRLISLGSDTFSATFPLYSAATTYIFDTWRCSDYAGNTARNTTVGTFAATYWTPPTGGGGGGGTVIQTQTIVTSDRQFCGDAICGSYLKEGNITYTENPGNCPADCKINVDNMFTCLLTDPKTCLYSESWFVNILLLVIVLGASYLILTQQQKRKGY